MFFPAVLASSVFWYCPGKSDYGTYMQASFEAAQLPPVHQTKPGMKALKVLPGQHPHAGQAKQYNPNFKTVPSHLPTVHCTTSLDCLVKGSMCPDAQDSRLLNLDTRRCLQSFLMLNACTTATSTWCLTMTQQQSMSAWPSCPTSSVAVSQVCAWCHAMA